MSQSTLPEVWYITGSQHLYGPAALAQVAANSQRIVQELNASGKLPYKVVFKPILTRPEEVRAVCLEANSAPNCAGLILWMHTFSPSKMWIGGLTILAKPFLHLHHPVQSRPAVGRNRHGFHEPQPVGPWRP